MKQRAVVLSSRETCQPALCRQRGSGDSRGSLRGSRPLASVSCLQQDTPEAPRAWSPSPRHSPARPGRDGGADPATALRCGFGGPLGSFCQGGQLWTAAGPVVQMIAAVSPPLLTGGTPDPSCSSAPGWSSEPSVGGEPQAQGTGVRREPYSPGALGLSWQAAVRSPGDFGCPWKAWELCSARLSPAPREAERWCSLLRPRGLSTPPPTEATCVRWW